MNFFISKICFITLILCLFQVSKATQSVDISRDFKILLMYFSEAFLKGATFDGKSLEGENPTTVSRYLVEAIENVENEYPELPDLSVLVRFKNQLAAGIPIAENIFVSKSGEIDKDNLRNDAVRIQNDFVKSLEGNNGLIMPIGWKGHALALIIKEGETQGTFDFAITNTGQGLQFHYHAADPNGVYPRLSQVWMEFKSVKAEDLFSDEAWFFQGLIMLKTEFFEKKLKKLFADDSSDELADYYPEYFYGSLLANFQEYLVPHREDRLVPMQRSGSCAVSSLIAAILYTSKSEKTFYLHKLKIGQALIKAFIVKARDNEKFRTIISDGFETNGRNFLRGIGSSLAHKTLEYLEFTLPEHFKHAGLIGSERFKWIVEKKEAANIALIEAEPVVYESVKTSIWLINEIMNFLKSNPISVSSNDIIITEKIRNQFAPLMGKNYDFGKSSVDLSSRNFYTFLNGTCNRLDEPLTSFDEFYAAFTHISGFSINSNKYYLILNVFQRAHEFLKNDSHLKNASTEQLLKLQYLCKTLALSFASFEEKMISFDHIVMLTYLQKLSWKLAVAYDQKLPEKQRIGLDTLAAPQTIESVLFGFKPIFEVGQDVNKNFLGGNLQQWMVHNCFDQKNVDIFLDLLKQDEMGNGEERFMGPESFCSLGDIRFNPKLPESHKNREVYLKMMGHPEVQKILRKLVDNPNLCNRWADMDTNVDNSNIAFSAAQHGSKSAPHHGKFIIVFSKGQNILVNYFPHYYNLMNTLALVRIGTIGNGKTGFGIGYWTDDNIDIIVTDPNNIRQAYTMESWLTNNQVLYTSYTTMVKNDPITTFNINNSYRKYENIFFKARHSLAFISHIDITNVGTWFNYVNSSSSAKLFDSTYFQYTTDHLLNVPKFDENKKIMFPIDEIAARSIIEELSRLIRVSLELIKAKNEQLLNEKRKSLIIRAVNVSVILTRFISRIDSENILTGSECANSLAQIYNLMMPFASFKTEYFLAKPEISRINFALGHICTVPIRNPLTFINNVNLETSIKGKRKTLKQYHWFAAKKGYVISGIGTSVADDQFNYGRSESQLNSEETKFLKSLLINYFLPGLINDPLKLNVNDYFLSYNYEMYLVRVQDQAAKIEIILNLWTGAVVFNGLCMLNSGTFINSQQFQNFFSSEDLHLVYNGIAAEVAGKAIYALPNFKGVSYLLSRESSDERNNELTIHRKWNGNWYDLISSEHIDSYFSGLYVDCDWVKTILGFSKEILALKTKK